MGNERSRTGVIAWIGGSLWPRLRQVGLLWSTKGGSFMAASQAFYIALAFFPLLIVLIATVGLVLRFSHSVQGVRDELVHLIAQQTSSMLASQVQQILAQVQVGAGLGGQLGLLALVVSLMSIFYHMQKAFDLIWEVKLSEAGGAYAAIRRLVIGEVQHFLIWLTLGILLLVAFVSAVALSIVQAFSSFISREVIIASLVPLLGTVSVNTLIFAFIYKTQPRVVVPWRDVWTGAVLAAIVWESARQLLALFVFGSKYNAYGVVGSFLALMVWLYIASGVLFMGAMFVRATGLARESHIVE